MILQRHATNVRTMARGRLETLWQKPRTLPKRKREPESDDHATDPHDDARDFQRRDDGATTLAKEDQLSDACSALLDEALAPYSKKVVKEMRNRHPPPRTEDTATWEASSACCGLPRHSPLTLLGPRRPPLLRAEFGSLRPQQIKGSLLPRCRDALV